MNTRHEKCNDELLQYIYIWPLRFIQPLRELHVLVIKDWILSHNVFVVWPQDDSGRKHDRMSFPRQATSDRLLVGTDNRRPKAALSSCSRFIDLWIS